MSTATVSTIDRLNMLGLRCDAAPADRLTSAVAALACFPMYMVANVHAWTAEPQFRVPLIDFPGSEAIREAFTIGKQEATLELSAEHRSVLGGLLLAPKAADRIIYDYALDTLRNVLAGATPALAATIRAAVARMVVAVARASGKGLLGTGAKVSDQERACIDHIAAALDLRADPAAAAMLEGL